MTSIGYLPVGVGGTTNSPNFMRIPEQVWYNISTPDTQGLPLMLTVRKIELTPGTSPGDTSRYLITADEVGQGVYLSGSDTSQYYRADTVHSMQAAEISQRQALERKVAALEAQLKESAEELNYYHHMEF